MTKPPVPWASRYINSCRSPMLPISGMMRPALPNGLLRLYGLLGLFGLLGSLNPPRLLKPPFGLLGLLLLLLPGPTRVGPPFPVLLPGPTVRPPELPLGAPVIPPPPPPGLPRGAVPPPPAPPPGLPVGPVAPPRAWNSAAIRSTGDVASARPLFAATPGISTYACPRPGRPVGFGFDGSMIPGAGAPRPRASIGYTATIDLLHWSIAAVTSMRASFESGKPEVNSTRLLRPLISPRFFANDLRPSSIVRAP